MKITRVKRQVISLKSILTSGERAQKKQLGFDINTQKHKKGTQFFICSISLKSALTYISISHLMTIQVAQAFM